MCQVFKMVYNGPENTKALILCAGNGVNWGNYLGRPKQLISINGERLLERTERLLHGRGCYDLEIVTHDERLGLSNCGFFRPPGYRWIVETLLSTYPLWSDRTIILLGDVFFTEKAIKAITVPREGIHVYGRPGPSWYTFKPHREIFAISFDKKEWSHIVTHAERTIRYAEEGNSAKFWQLYQSLAGFPFKDKRIEKDIFFPIHDLTDYIDCPEDYNRVVKMLACYTSTKRFKRLLMVFFCLGAGARNFLLCLKKYFKYSVKVPLRRKLKAVLKKS